MRLFFRHRKEITCNFDAKNLTHKQKRMFKKILDALSTQYKGVDARILTRMARKLAKTVKSEEEVDEAVQGVTVMDFIDLEGDRRASAATESAVKNYEKKYNLKDGKPNDAGTGEKEGVDEDDPDGGNGNDTETGGGNAPKPSIDPANAKGGRNRSSYQSKLERQIAALTETVSTLTGTITKMQQERTSKSRKQQYEELFEGVDEKTKNRYMRNFDRLSFKDDEDFAQWLEDMTPQVTEELKGLSTATTQQAVGAGTGTHRGATPPLGGRSNAKPGQLSPEFKSYMAKQKARAANTQYSTIAGLPQAQVQPQTQSAPSATAGGQQ